jgi:hypothetical protein
MRITIRFAATALWVCCLAALPTYADDEPWALLEGYRCEIMVFGGASPGVPEATILVCHIGDDGNPLINVFPPVTKLPSAPPTLDSLFHLRPTLNHTLFDPSLPQHDINTAPPPAP